MDLTEHEQEQQLWIALLVARYGRRNGPGYQLRIPAQEAERLRSLLPQREPIVIIGAGGPDFGEFILDVL